MPPAAPSPRPPALREEGLAAWRQFHQEAMARMSELALALDRRGWPAVQQACRWVHETCDPHNEWEEQRLFPLLEQAGGKDLREQLSQDHREMSGLARAILAGAGAEAQHGLRARRLLDLVRQHLDTEALRMLPLLQGCEGSPEPPDMGEGYRRLPRPRTQKT